MYRLDTKAQRLRDSGWRRKSHLPGDVPEFRVADPAALLLERGRARVFAEDDSPLSADPLGLHRFVRRGHLDHPVRVDSALVAEAVVPDDRLVHAPGAAAQLTDEAGPP